MSIDAHALMSTIDMGKLIPEVSRNLQISEVIKAMASSEPCLFNNSENNLMPVAIKENDWIITKEGNQ